ELLAAVAYQMHCGGEERKLIDRDALERLVAAYLRPRTQQEHEATDLARTFLSELPVHIGLLDEVEQNRFGFSHLSFQEFLAARYIAESDRWGELLDHFQASWWREVILLCAGHLSQERCWRFLEQLAARGDMPSEHAAALALAADALSELEIFKGQGPVRAVVRDAALRLLEGHPPDAVPAAARVRCGYALARVGDPRPDVCTLPPAMVELEGGSYVIGITSEETDQVRDLWRAHWRAEGKAEEADSYADHFAKSETNATAAAVQLRPFA